MRATSEITLPSLLNTPYMLQLILEPYDEQPKTVWIVQKQEPIPQPGSYINVVQGKWCKVNSVFFDIANNRVSVFLDPPTNQVDTPDIVKLEQRIASLEASQKLQDKIIDGCLAEDDLEGEVLKLKNQGKL